MDYRFIVVILAVILIIGVIDTAISKISAFAKLRWRMKYNKGPVILGIIVFLCLCAAGFAMYLDRINYNPQTSEHNNQVTTTIDNVVDNSEVYETYDFSDCYLYSQMDDFSRDLYQIYYDLVQHKNDSGYKRTISMEEWKYNTSKDVFHKVYFAMLEDHPELFYLDTSDTSRLQISGYSRAGVAHLDISLNPGSSDEDILIRRFNDAVDEFMDEINLDASPVEIELQIHDKLIGLVSYDHAVLVGTDSHLAHTAYGALVNDGCGHRNSAVCDGYAKAYQYLLRRAGIVSVVVSGTAGTLDGSFADEGPHAWNLVLLDGEWYEVDCCWDDIDLEYMDLSTEDITYVEALDPEYFASTHWFYNRTTEEMKLVTESDDYVIIIPKSNGYISFNQCRQAFHLREMDAYDETYESFSYIRDMLPIANGTKYGLGL